MPCNLFGRFLVGRPATARKLRTKAALPPPRDILRLMRSGDAEALIPLVVVRQPLTADEWALLPSTCPSPTQLLLEVLAPLC